MPPLSYRVNYNTFVRRSGLRTCALPTLVIGVSVFAASCGSSPLKPTTSQAVALTSIRYVRHYPVVAPGGFGPDLSISYPIPGDPYGRGESKGGTLLPDADGSFSDPQPSIYQIPVNTTFSVWIRNDSLGSAHAQVAQDIWINGTHLAPVVRADGEEQAIASIDANGVVTSDIAGHR